MDAGTVVAMITSGGNAQRECGVQGWETEDGSGGKPMHC